MCGRFILLTDLSVITESFHIQEVSCEYRPDDNISPSQQVVAVLRRKDQNYLVNFRWGLIPSWAKDPSIGTWTSSEGKHVHTCTIITTESNDLLRPIHDRMPVIMSKERETAWIDPDNRHQKGLLSLLKPYPAVEMDRADMTDFMHSGVNHVG